MARGEGYVLGLCLWMTALLHNGHGRYGEALTAAQQACEHEDVIAYGWSLVELIEAGVRVGRHAEAATALDRLSERTQASGTDWALGIEAGSRALLTDTEYAEPLYREAVERLGCTRGVVHLARARLLYGEWLRRENRRVDAREQLRAAHETFSGIGAEGFAERARHELLATGETARKRSDDVRSVLTPQEAHIARLARDGLSNPEIGAQLFISPRTVQYHLRKVFQKLDITSRNQLSRLPASSFSPALAAGDVLAGQQGEPATHAGDSADATGAPTAEPSIHDNSTARGRAWRRRAHTSPRSSSSRPDGEKASEQAFAAGYSILPTPARIISSPPLRTISSSSRSRPILRGRRAVTFVLTSWPARSVSPRSGGRTRIRDCTGSTRRSRCRKARKRRARHSQLRSRTAPPHAF